MDVILAGVKWQHALVYLDGILVFSKTPGTHIKHVHQVRTLLQRAGVTMKVKMCIFFHKHNRLLGACYKTPAIENRLSYG